MKARLHPPPSKLPTDVKSALSLIKHTAIGFDRLTFHVDHPAPNIPASEIELHCTKLNVITGRSLPYHPIWQTRVDVFQPSNKALSLLAKAMGTRHAARLSYAEPAIDWLVDNDDAAYSLCKFFLEHLHVPYLRHDVAFFKETAYFAPRADQHAEKNARNVVLYADRASKLWPAHELKSPCCHLEYRLHGVGTLANQGLLTLADCVQFDHRAFWAENLRLYCLPKMAELGRWLDPDNIDVTDSALRKRANVFLDQYRHHEIFVLQNLWRDVPETADVLLPVANELFLDIAM
ncbi:hypothetical protein N5J06_20135 [Ralstonia sp. CHL-2022]|uniref:Uncharacterized protein n=1 Tax=Ralstonia mojiangensis TaxID=2953895 RepID=A0ABT2LD05_9RALS|nr:hypothetical protein [Ralstonia mojiangensis]MCT7313290.1 hypothetical protein [Ralstonia mojiangensis]